MDPHEQVMTRWAPQPRVILSALRDAVRRAAADAEERANPVTGAISFGYGARPEDQVCVALPDGDAVSVVFYAGNALTDPDGLLKGSGLVHRSLRLTSAAEPVSAAVVNLVRRAAAACRARKSTDSSR